MAKIADLFGVTTDYLLGRPEEIESKTKSLDVDDAIKNMRSYQGRPISDSEKEVLKDIIKGYLDRSGK